MVAKADNVTDRAAYRFSPRIKGCPEPNPAMLYVGDRHLANFSSDSDVAAIVEGMNERALLIARVRELEDAMRRFVFAQPGSDEYDASAMAMASLCMTEADYRAQSEDSPVIGPGGAR